MQKRFKTIIISIIGVIIIAIVAYVFIGKIVLKSIMSDYLKENGYSSNEIARVKVGYSFISYLLSYGAWGISVEYLDEPEILYFYKYQNKTIITNGVGGSPKTGKEDLKHLVSPTHKKRYAEIYNSLEAAIIWQSDATFVIRNEYNCTQSCKTNWTNHNCWYGSVTSKDLIDQGYLRQSEMLDVDGKSYCKSTIYTYLTDYDNNSCDIEYEIGIKCLNYETPGYLEHPDLLFGPS